MRENRQARSSGAGPQLRITYLLNQMVEIVNQNKTVGEGIKKTF